MFIDQNGKVWLDLYEQVEKNKNDIYVLKGVGGTLNEFGIKVLDVLSDASLIPATGEEYGDAYAIGTQAPYQIYIWTRTEDPNVGEWLNIGLFPAPGPQGPQGERGPQGAQGLVGPKGDTGAQGTQGVRGLQGQKGDTGPQGEQGPRGPQGDPGASFHIVAQIANTSGLPTPTKALQLTGAAYEVGANLDVYLIVGNDNDGYVWVNHGPIGGIEGPQGPQGIQGVPGTTGQQGEQGPKGDTGNTGATGPRGYVYIPSVDASGNISWSNDGGLTNPATVNIKGPKGDTGNTGPQGQQGERGPQGPKGDTGNTGPQGPAGGTYIYHSGAMSFDYLDDDELRTLLHKKFIRFWMEESGYIYPVVVNGDFNYQDPIYVACLILEGGNGWRPYNSNDEEKNLYFEYWDTI